MPRFINGRTEATKDDLLPDVEPLTPAERGWVHSLEEVLKLQPERLLLVAWGASLHVIDRAAARRVEPQQSDGRAQGAWLADVRWSAKKLAGLPR